MSWIEIRARFSPWPEDASPVIDAFVDHGIENTLEDGDELVGCLVDVPSSAPQVESLRATLEDLGASEITIRDLAEDNWEVAWKQFFKPRRIGRHIVIRPTWEDFPIGNEDIEIVLDPGQAFGTGDHPTTRLCLELLDRSELRGLRVLDLGCGSGILAIGAKKLGADRVVAVDIDPIAVDVTRQNAILNQTEVESSVANKMIASDWDLVISNIISATLIRLAKSVYEGIRGGGTWIVSGIIADNWTDVLTTASANGFILREKLEEDGWVAAKFDRP